MAQYLSLPATNGHTATTPDSAALSITGDVDLIAYVAATDWTPANQRNIVGKVANDLTGGYILSISGGSNGFLRYGWHDGTSAHADASTSAVPFSDGEGGWVRVSHDVDNGATQNVVTFYTSTDPVTTAPGSVSWTQLTQVVNTGTTSIVDGTSPGIVGGQGTGGFSAFNGKIYGGYIYNGIGGTLVGAFIADDFEVGDSGSDTAVSSETGETWTINGAGSEILADPVPSGGDGSLLLLGVG